VLKFFVKHGIFFRLFLILSDINISHGSVATHLTCGGIVKIDQYLAKWWERV